jgi:hypothetical protein
VGCTHVVVDEVLHHSPALQNFTLAALLAHSHSRVGAQS